MSIGDNHTSQIVVRLVCVSWYVHGVVCPIHIVFCLLEECVLVHAYC